MILYINACARKESRTKRLADHLIEKLSPGDREVQKIDLVEYHFPKTDEEFLGRRDRLAAKGEFDDEIFSLAKQFKEADKIVIAAPFYDLSFPACLKQYMELINVVGVTFSYSDKGIPVGLCKADSIYYVTTAGGDFFPEEFGFGYVKALAESFYGIKTVKLIKVTGLDIWGADVDKLMEQGMAEIDGLFHEKPERFKCPCCGYLTYTREPSGTYDICPVCYWEDDPVQLEDENFEGGANKVSLVQARKNFEEFGACEKRLLPYVREPLEIEI